MEALIYNQKGEEAGKIKLPEGVFGLPKNDDLVHQVVVSMQSNMRNIVAHVKERGDVRGGGKKPWQQKGTGRARHGSIRSPLWRGGGVTHGPNKDKNYDRKINKKMKAKALYTILSQKMSDGEILFVDNLSFAKPKTAEAVGAMKSFSKIKEFKNILSKKNNAAYLALGKINLNAGKSFSNLNNVKVDDVRNLNPLDAMNYKYLIIEQPEESIKFIQGKLEKKTSK
ncbi:MAG: 50S ribosomal protein L4 [Patescibacteria group bacterium]|nr:50S ribosomal protein L4 [Patescibacteria group bacterium]MDE1988546.1 50S ribosomal protein L4 [Patescibacteria group bacterium]MDE2217898.1 50S ribosomal protein L4 [Patescibacteria group bacterium]